MFNIQSSNISSLYDQYAINEKELSKNLLNMNSSNLTTVSSDKNHFKKAI